MIDRAMPTVSNMAKSKYSSSAPDAVVFSTFQGEKQLEELVKLIDKDLSEPDVSLLPV